MMEPHFPSTSCSLEKLKTAPTPPSSNTRDTHQAIPTTPRSVNSSRLSAMPMSQSICAVRAAQAVRSVTSKNLNRLMATTPLKQSPRNHGYLIMKSAWSASVTPASVNFLWPQRNRQASPQSRHYQLLTTAHEAPFVPAEF